MEKKIVTIAAISGVCLAFVILSGLVFITKRNPYFVSKKLKLGALLLTLTGWTAGCSHPVVACYEVAVDVFTIENQDPKTNAIVISRSQAEDLNVNVNYRVGNSFSYVFFDSIKTVKHAADMLPEDGLYDKPSESFKIPLPDTIVPGNYEIRFYSTIKDSITNYDWYAGSFQVRVVD